MTAIFMDGFETYGTGAASVTNMLEGVYAQVDFGGGVATPSWGARTGTYALISRNAFDAARYVLPATKTRVFISCGFSMQTLPSVNFANQIFSFRNGANVVIANLWVQSTGVIVLADVSNNVLASTQGPVVVAQNWHFLEMDFNIAGQAFVLRVDDSAASGTPVINVSGLSLVGPLAQIALAAGNTGSAALAYMDDLFIRDTAGTVNNSWLGDRRIATLLASGDTATAGWTPNYYQKLGAGILDNTTASAAVSAATATSLNVGAGDFTIESFVRFESLPTGSNKAVIFGKWDETANQRSYELFLGSVALNGGSLCFQSSTDGTISTVLQPVVYPFTPVLDTWYHIALVRSSNNLLLFVNGQQLGLPIADARTYFVGTAPMSLGGQVEAGGAVANTSVNGWFDETRFTVGFARYTANFTPTTIQFPRNVGGDPQFANVQLLCGFDSLIQDESGAARVLTARNGTVQKMVSDGPLVGVWSTIGKAVPDDNTFISAPFLPATGVLTITANPANTNTVTVGTKDGTIAAVYTFKTVLTGAAFEVLIDTNIQNSLQNLFNAINAGPGIGTKYGTGTTSNFDVTASQLPAGQMQVSANIAGTAGNSIATTVSGITGSWGHATLTGGTAIPGPSNFKVQHLPPRTTLISAIQTMTRALKSDAGAGTLNTALVGPLGGLITKAAHSLTVGPNYYTDIYETDPDTAGPISPTTLINGSIQVNRDT